LTKCGIPDTMGIHHGSSLWAPEQGNGKMVRIHRCPATVTGDEIRNEATGEKDPPGRRGE